MNLSQVEIVVAIAKAGSISQAAQNMYISQPAVSKSLQNFEDELGTKIFERVSTGVRLTSAGQRFVEQALDLIEQMDKLKEQFVKKNTLTTMTLSVASMSYHFIQCVLGELYHRYSYSPLQIRYTECGFDMQTEKIASGEVEIGVVTLWKGNIRKMVKRAAIKGVEYHHICNATLYVAVSESSASYPKDIHDVDFKRLSKMPIVSISPSMPYKGTGWDFVVQLFKDELKPSHQEITTTNTGTMREILNRIDGFTLVLLNDGIKSRFGFFNDIRLIPCPDEKYVFEQGWLQRDNTVRSPMANDFINMLLENCTE